MIDGYWYCDYTKQNISKEPIDKKNRSIVITPSSGQYNIRSGPYSKVLVASITEDGIDITNKIHDYSWRCYLGDEDITGQLTPEYDDNKIVLHMTSYDYIGETLRVEATADGHTCSIELEVIA